MVLFFDRVSYPVLNLPNLQIHNGTPEYYNICFTKTKTDNSQKKIMFSTTGTKMTLYATVIFVKHPSEADLTKITLVYEKSSLSLYYLA